MDDDDGPNIPPTSNPREWYTWFYEHAFEVPEKEREKILRVWRSIVVTQKDTLGETFKTQEG